MKITYNEFLEALKIVNNYKNQMEKHYEDVKNQYEGIHKFSNVSKEQRLYDVENISNRTLNCIKAATFIDNKLEYNWTGKHKDRYKSIEKVKDFENIKISELKKMRNFGNKGLQEIEKICFYAGVKLLR